MIISGLFPLQKEMRHPPMAERGGGNKLCKLRCSLGQFSPTIVCLMELSDELGGHCQSRRFLFLLFQMWPQKAIEGL